MLRRCIFATVRHAGTYGKNCVGACSLSGVLTYVPIGRPPGAFYLLQAGKKMYA